MKKIYVLLLTSLAFAPTVMNGNDASEDTRGKIDCSTRILSCLNGLKEDNARELACLNKVKKSIDTIIVPCVDQIKHSVNDTVIPCVDQIKHSVNDVIIPDITILKASLLDVVIPCLTELKMGQKMIFASVMEILDNQETF